jgi:hypothetical protein
MKLIESNMEFDFSAFDSARQYDTPENQCTGLKVVDFVAEDSKIHYFIEVKNYANMSIDAVVQANMDMRQKNDYLMLSDEWAAFPLIMGMKFKDSLLRWLASGQEFTKPVALLLVMNPPAELKARERERLGRRIEGCIPIAMNNKPDQYPKLNSMFFDMPTLAEAQERYGLGVAMVAAAASPS